MRGEHDLGTRLLRQSGIDVEAVAFHWHSPRLIANAAKFSIKIVSNRSLVAGDGLDVDELASECDSVHEGRE